MLFIFRDYKGDTQQMGQPFIISREGLATYTPLKGDSLFLKREEVKSMKKAIAITLVVVILGIFALPPKAKAGGAAEGAVIGAAVGLVTALVLWVVKSAERGATADDKLVQNNKDPVRDKESTQYNLVQENPYTGISKEWEVQIYAYKLEF